jgi:class 3 adenylate cyclase
MHEVPETRCPSCDAMLPADALFCGRCGKRLAAARTCAGCGRRNPADMRFCLGCGAPTEAGRQQVTKERPPSDRSPRAYTPKHLADKILTSRSALEGERKQVSVLFADVKGSMELAEALDPEAWHAILDRFFEILTDGVHRFEGTVNQYTGDGVMALFGAPIAHEDHAQRACFAALALRDAVGRYADELRVAKGLNFSVRMGINSGEVVVGKIGDDLRMDYTAQGHSVGLAQRMEQLAAQGKALLTEHTAKLVEGYFALRDLGATQLKGASEPLHVFELEGIGTARTRLDVSRARGLSRFVGRADEMHQVEAALERALAGQGQVIGIVAEPGTGKSRLCYELAERCRARGITTRTAIGVPHGKSVPYLPVIELLRDIYELDERESPRAQRNKVAGAVLLLDRELEPALPLLFDFLAISDPERPGPPLAGEERERRLLGLIRRMIEARSRQEPVVMVIEDLHWIDSGTEAFVATVVEAAAHTRTLLLLTFRPEYHAAWMQRSHCQQLPLLPLAPEAVAELLRELLGTDPSLAGLASRIQEHTAGNPFFLEEVVQDLAESGRLQGLRGRYRLAAPVASLGIPTTVRAVLAARIDRQPAREKGVLQSAAVIGPEFGERTLLAVQDLSREDLGAALRTLVSAELIYEAALYPEALYAFKHPLTREVAYESQLGERRRRTHAAVGHALEAQIGEEEPGERAALVAHHFDAAAEVEPALRWHVRAAEWAARSNFARAIEHHRRVFELAERLPPSPERAALEIQTGEWILFHGWRVGMSPEETDRVRARAEEAARRASDPVAGATFEALGAADRSGRSGRFAETLPQLERAHAVTEASGDLRRRVVVGYLRFSALQSAGHPSEALVSARGVTALCSAHPELLADDLTHVPGLLAWAGRLVAANGLGRLSEATVVAAELRNVARRDGSAFAAVLLAAAEGQETLYRDPAAAIPQIVRTLESARQLGSPALVAVLSWRLGLLQLRLNQFEAAGATLEPLLAFPTVEINCRAALALALGGQGFASRALREAGRAVAQAEERGLPSGSGEAWLALAQATLLAEGAAARAEVERVLDRADAYAAERKLAMLGCDILEARAALARALGDEAARARFLDEAERRYSEMGAPGYAALVAEERAG